MFVSTLTIGGLSKSELRQRLKEAGVQFNRISEVIFEDARFVTLPTPVPIRLTAIPVAALGLLNGGTFEAVVVAAQLRGLSLCPLEVGPHLRLAWSDQPEGAIGAPATQHCAPPGSVTVASAELEPEDESAPKGFYLRCIKGELWLRGYHSWSGHIWAPEDVFVFVRGQPGVRL